MAGLWWPQAAARRAVPYGLRARGVLSGLVLALLLGPLTAAAARAEDEDAVDCSVTPFAFAGEGYFVDCLRIEARAAKDGASGQTQRDVITITSSDRTMFLTVLSDRLTATRLYMRRRDLRSNMRDSFSSIELNKWNGLGNKSGYDMAEFESEISGQPSNCIALQRYLNPMYDGYKRHVIGIGCAAAGDLDAVYAALAQLRAPGD